MVGGILVCRGWRFQLPFQNKYSLLSCTRPIVFLTVPKDGPVEKFIAHFTRQTPLRLCNDTLYHLIVNILSFVKKQLKYLLYGTSSGIYEKNACGVCFLGARFTT